MGRQSHRRRSTPNQGRAGPDSAAVEYVIAILVFGVAVALVVVPPLRRPERAETADEARRESLEAAKEAKYREIRDADLDHRMGKLSDDDYRATDGELRRQAMEILRQLDELEPAEPREAPLT
jgi:flagellar biosynthesis/type III secretory pathway M-ring protein FliF/YscJ